MWNKDEAQGKADQVKGRIKEQVAGINDDERLREEGEGDRASGKVQESFGKGRRKVGEAFEDLGEDMKR